MNPAPKAEESLQKKGREERKSQGTGHVLRDSVS